MSRKLCTPAKISKDQVQYCITAGIAVCLHFPVPNDTEPLVYYFQRSPKERVWFEENVTDENGDVYTEQTWAWKGGSVQKVFVPLYGGRVAYTDELKIHGKTISWSQVADYVQSAESVYAAPYWMGPPDPYNPETSFQRARRQRHANAVALGIIANEEEGTSVILQEKSAGFVPHEGDEFWEEKRL